MQKSILKGAVDDLHSAMKAKAAEFQNVVEDAWFETQSRVQTWQTEIGAYIQQNPTKAVFMAVGVGFCLEPKAVEIRAIVPLRIRTLATNYRSLFRTNQVKHFEPVAKV